MNHTELFAALAFTFILVVVLGVAASFACIAMEEFIHAQKQLVRLPLPAMPAFNPAPRHPALPAPSASFYLAARAARLDLSLGQFFILAFDKAPSATPAAFSALTPKQIATRRGAQHKFYLRCEKIKASIL